MICKVGERLRHHLKSFLESKRKRKRVEATILMREKMLADELGRLGVPLRQQAQVAGYLVDFLIGDQIVE
jgi:hypothetical protein